MFSFDRGLIAALVDKLERRMAITVSVADGHILVALKDGTFEGAITRHRLAPSTCRRPYLCPSDLCPSALCSSVH